MTAWKNEKKNMEAKCELGVMIIQAREIWQVGEDEIMSRGAMALAGAAQLMQIGLILICFSHGHVSRVPNGGTGAKMY